MKKIGLVRTVGIFLFIVFTLQITNLTCLGEDTSFIYPQQQHEYQLKSAGLNITSSAVSIIGHCQCPCHFSFTRTSSIINTSCLAPGLPLIQKDELLIPEISSGFFQPPKLLNISVISFSAE